MTSGPGYESTPIFLFAGSVFTIPDPSSQQSVQGTGPMPTPPSLRYVVLTNSSPFTLLVSHGYILGELAAFTSDVFDLWQGGYPTAGDSTPLTVLARSPNISGGAGAAILGQQDTTLYAVWYENDPGDIYPAALGAGEIVTLPLADIFNDLTVPPGGFSIGPLDMSGWNAISLTFIDQSGLAITSWTIDLQWVDQQNAIGPIEHFALARSNSLMTIRPCYTQRVIININGTGPNPGTQTGHLVVTGLRNYGGKSFALPNGPVLLDNATANIAAGITAPVGVTLNIFGGPADLLVRTGAQPWSVEVDELNETTGLFSRILHNVRSQDLPSSGLANGPVRATLPIILGHKPVQVQFTNSSGGAANFTASIIASDR